MKGFFDLPTPEKGNDLLDVLTSDLVKSLVRFRNASWEIILPNGLVVAGVGGDTRITFDLSNSKLGGYEQPGQLCIQGQVYDFIFIGKSAPVLAS